MKKAKGEILTSEQGRWEALARMGLNVLPNHDKPQGIKMLKLKVKVQHRDENQGIGGMSG